MPDKKRDVLVTVIQHMPCGQIAAIGVVDPNIMVVMVITIAVNQDNGNLCFFHLLVECVGIHADDNDAIQVPLLSQGEIALVRVCCGNENVVALLAGIVLDAAQYFTVEAVLEHQTFAGFRLRNNDANQLGIPHAEPPCI